MKKNLVKLFALVLSVSMVLACLSLTVGATEDTLQITVGQAQGAKGETVNVPLTITANPGVSSLTLSVAYGDGLTLTSVTDGGILGTYESDDKNFESPFILSWSNDTAAANVTATGKLATLTFTIATDAAIGDQTITVTCDGENDGALDYDMNPVATSITNGSIIVGEDTFVDGGECGANATWALYESGRFVIQGTGATTNYTSGGDRPWDKKASLIKTAEVCDGITSVGSYTFIYASNMTSVTFADSVTKVGAASFFDCPALVDIEWSDNITSIGYHAFYKCNSLTDIVLPSSLTSLGDNAFLYCGGLKSVVIPEGVTKIDTATFRMCTSLEKISIPSTVTSIGNQAFYGCKMLKTVVLPENLQLIDNFAFWNCSSLNNIRITAKNIGTSVFGHDGPVNSNLTDVDFTSNVETIGLKAFNGCDSVTNIYYEGNAASWDQVSVEGGNNVITTPLFVVADGTCGDNAKWALYANGSLNINGKGLMNDYTQGNAPWASYADQIKKVNVFDEIENIGAYAFDGCTNLTEAYIGKYVTVINANAFTNTAINNIIINSEITYIGENAFDDLETVYFDRTSADVTLYVTGAANVNAQNVHYALDHGSCGDTSYWAVYDDNSLVITGAGFISEYYIPDPNNSGKYYHADRPWADYYEVITSLVVNNGITQVGTSAFKGLTALKNVTLPSSLKVLRHYSFYDCTALENIDIPESIKTVGNYVFYGCTALKSIVLSDDLESLGEGVFQDNKSLTYAKIPRIRRIPTKLFMGCSSLERVTFDKYLEVIGESAFYQSGLTAISIPYNIKTIERQAFFKCLSLKSVSIPAQVTTIYQNTFRGCENLTTVYIPESVTTIEQGAFQYTGITTVYYQSESLDGWNTLLENKGASNDELDSATCAIIAHSGTCNETAKWELYTNGTLAIFARPENDNAVATLPNYNPKKSNYAPWYDYKDSITSIDVQDYVKIIGGYVFADCTNVTSVKLGIDVIEIKGSAFSGMTGLQNIEFVCLGPVNIYEYAFDGATAISTVKFAGTAEQWNAFTIGTKGNATFTAVTPTFAG